MSWAGQLDVRAPATAAAFRQRDRAGMPMLVVVARLTYSVAEAGTVSFHPTGSPIRIVAERDPTLVGPPGEAPRPSATIRYPADTADDKPGTDVIMVGCAHPPDARAESMDVRLAVGDVTRTVRVYGPRVYYQAALGVVPGPPAKLTRTPLLWELTYGGADRAHPDRLERRNPIGTGFAADERELIGRAAPPIEDPEAPLSSRAPAPAGFAAIPPSWSPRLERFGTADEAWHKERAPIAPLDFDPRHHACAPPGLWRAEPLHGDEPVTIVGVSAAPWSFRLPALGLLFQARVAGVEVELPTHLDTFLVDADARRVELTWRARVAVDKTAAVGWVGIFPDRPVPRELLMKPTERQVSA